MEALTSLNKKIIACDRCPRLRKHCLKIAREKRRQFQADTYWGKPVPGFGDSNPRILVVGLAPAAHGANRTGRMFTGDNSGLWLYRALYRAGFASQAESLNAQDGLKLKDVYITATARCAPPQNKLTPREIENCRPYFQSELREFKRVKTFVVLGQVALRALWSNLSDAIKPKKALPKFSHLGEVNLKNGQVILMSYHPSQQNTFTRKLTEPMFDAVFNRVKTL